MCSSNTSRMQICFFKLSIVTIYGRIYRRKMEKRFGTLRKAYVMVKVVTQYGPTER